MAETTEQQNKQETPAAPSGPARSKDEIALELMKFIAVSTGYGKGLTTGAGFSGKPSSKSPTPPRRKNMSPEIISGIPGTSFSVRM